jgi:DNA-binding CsgD family transcriptional regulator
MNNRKKKSYIRLFVAMLACFHVGELVAQGINLGIPPVWNYSKKKYQAGTQNWDAAQDSRGVLYFANNEGLLQYDGNTWKCYPVANNTVVRSVSIDPLGRIFVGAQSELGYFLPDERGVLQYHSLLGLLPVDKRNFEDVWDVQFEGGDVFFRTNRVVFQYSGVGMQVHEPGGDLTAMFATSRGLFLQQNFSNLLRFEGGAFRTALQLPQLKSALTGSVGWLGDSILFTSLKNGFFYLSGNTSGLWKTPQDVLFHEKRIYSAALLPNHQLALGTSLNGVIVLDQSRRIAHHLTQKSGLQNNNILCTFADGAGNLWLGLDSGIDCVVLDAPFSSVIPDGELQGTGYSAAVFKGQLYLGVSNGVYQAPWKPFYDSDNNPIFHKLKATDGQVWDLQVLDDILLLGHHEGAFSINETGNQLLSAEPGAWTFVRLTDGYLLGGTYNGLVLYKKSGGKWVFDQKLSGLNESCRIMVKDPDGSVWVAHPYRGLYRIEWSQAQKTGLKATFYNAQNGLPSDLNNLVFEIAGKVVITTEKGVMRFDSKRSIFVPDADFNRLFGEIGRIRHLQEDKAGNIWYVAEKEVGVLQVHDFGLSKEVQKRVYPELAEKLVGGFEFIYPIDEQNILFGAEQGFMVFNAAATSPTDTVLKVVLNNVTASGTRDSMLFGGWFVHGSDLSMQQNKDDIPQLDAGMNNLRCSFSATDYKSPDFLQYRVKLEGLDRDWSDWTSETVRIFTNLSPGQYSFQVQARRKDGLESKIASFSFVVCPPWYKSVLALILYALVFVGFFAGFLLRQQQKFESEKEKLTKVHQQAVAQQQREVEQSKAAVTEIQNEKLEAEIRYNNQELAMATMHLVQKGEILLTVQENLNKIFEKSADTAVKKEIQQLLNLLNFDTQLDEDWQQFAFHFDQVHVDFLKRLREQYTQLGINDQKLCAYLRMNLTTKEIAPLMNISVRGVEASRYRLRKKLDLPNDANLTDFMMRI